MNSASVISTDEAPLLAVRGVTKIFPGVRALDGVDHLSAVVMAYEPIWAVGTGRAATPEDANATIGLIRRTVGEVGGPAIAAGLQVQYGGSVTAENFGAFIAQPEIDGALVGGASLKADQFIEMVRLANTQAIP